MRVKIQKSAEDYLEAILMLNLRTGNVRSIDIARELGFSKPSVSVAMKNLRQDNYITVDGEGYITLTDTGMEVATKIYERHTVITKLLIKLGVDEKTAADDACRIEHVISNETFGAIKKAAKDIL